MYVITRFEDVRRVLTDPKNFVSAAALRKGDGNMNARQQATHDLFQAAIPVATTLAMALKSRLVLMVNSTEVKAEDEPKRFDAITPERHAAESLADELRVKQALVNLLSNAIKFTDRGGAISVVTRRQDDGSVRVTVADTGVGISSEDIAVALSEFGQVDGTLTRKHEGTGLGLTLSRKLIELHGGALEMESEVGQGTSVHLVFPVKRSLRLPQAS